MGFLVFWLFVLVGILVWYIGRLMNQQDQLISHKLNSSLELKKTMVMGLAYRFNFPQKKNEVGEHVYEEASKLFLKQKPLDFEEFCAEIFKKKLGGKVFTTPKTGDHGVDFEHYREDGLYLAQVKVYKKDVDFEPIAILHSNIVKKNANGGYVITTSSFTPAAKKYAEGLGIELIDGVELVNYWLETIGSEVYEIGEELA